MSPSDIIVYMKSSFKTNPEPNSDLSSTSWKIVGIILIVILFAVFIVIAIKLGANVECIAAIFQIFVICFQSIIRN